MEPVIVVRSLSKCFPRYHPHRPATLHQALTGGFRRLHSVEHYWALRNINLSVAPGQMLGIIGPNGAGKSTLLRLIGGIGRPDEGWVRARGRIGALVDLWAGFHPDLTGRENVFVAGVVAGLTRAEVLERFDSIVAFAELEEFMENPLRTYSTGMQMRLAFAVAAHTDPDILLIDEVLAVGDLAFQRKCLQRIVKFRAGGCAVVLVSHDMQLVRQLCDYVIWLGAGRMAAHGPADAVIRQYESEMNAETRRRTPHGRPPARTSYGAELRVNENRFGSLELEIVAVRLLDGGGRIVSELDSGEPLRVAMEYVCREDIEAAIFGVTITRDDDLICYDTSTRAAGLTFSPPRGHGHITLHIDELDLVRGNYYVNVGAYQVDWAYAFDHHWRAYPLAIRSADRERGVVRLPHRWELEDL